MKICIKCNIELQLDNFSIAKGNKDGFCNKCKNCVSTYVKNHTIKNKVKIAKQRKEFREANKERLSKPEIYVILNNKICTVCDIDKPIDEFNKCKRNKDAHRFECKICQSKKQKNYNQNNPEISKNYRIVNKDILNIKKNNKKKTDIQFKITCNLRTRLWGAIKNNFKSGSAVSDLGCTISDFKIYIEKQFKDGMTWENWGRDTWHLDHKNPLTNFDLTNREQLLMAVHYSNIQPLWANENLEKSSKY